MRFIEMRLYDVANFTQARPSCGSTIVLGDCAWVRAMSGRWRDIDVA